MKTELLSTRQDRDGFVRRERQTATVVTTFEVERHVALAWQGDHLTLTETSSGSNSLAVLNRIAFASAADAEHIAHRLLDLAREGPPEAAASVHTDFSVADRLVVADAFGEASAPLAQGGIFKADPSRLLG